MSDLRTAVPLNRRIAFEEQRLQQLGRRPVKNEVPGIGLFLIFCYLPVPIGWIVWIVAFNVFTTKYQTSGLVGILLIVAGFIFNEIEKKNQAAFDKVHAPFQEIDDILYSLRRELRKLP